MDGLTLFHKVGSRNVNKSIALYAIVKKYMFGSEWPMDKIKQSLDTLEKSINNCAGQLSAKKEQARYHTHWTCRAKMRVLQAIRSRPANRKCCLRPVRVVVY